MGVDPFDTSLYFMQRQETPCISAENPLKKHCLTLLYNIIACFARLSAKKFTFPLEKSFGSTAPVSRSSPALRFPVLRHCHRMPADLRSTPVVPHECHLPPPVCPRYLDRSLPPQNRTSARLPDVRQSPPRAEPVQFLSRDSTECRPHVSAVPERHCRTPPPTTDHGLRHLTAHLQSAQNAVRPTSYPDHTLPQFRPLSVLPPVPAVPVPPAAAAAPVLRRKSGNSRHTYP